MGHEKDAKMSDQPKKTYLKPEVTQVALRPDEAVLGNCKLSMVTGPATMNCGSFVCSSVGS